MISGQLNLSVIDEMELLGKHQRDRAPKGIINNETEPSLNFRMPTFGSSPVRGYFKSQKSYFDLG